MTLRRPKFVFDTQVISYLSDGTIPRVEWNAVRKFMSRRARYAISSISLYELLAGIEGGDEAHFRENQLRIKVLCEPEKRKFLPLPGRLCSISGVWARAQKSGVSARKD
jgi:hypothetical protein